MDQRSKTHYKRRNGTTDLGGLFETYVISWYALKVALDEDIKDARIATNIDGYGDFDDFVIRMTNKDGKDKLYAMQLKHKEKPKFFTSYFGGTKQAIFNLAKHHKSFKDIKESFRNVDKLQPTEDLKESVDKLQPTEDLKESADELEPTEDLKESVDKLQLTEDLELKDMVACFYSNVEKNCGQENIKIKIGDKDELCFSTKLSEYDDSLFQTAETKTYTFHLTSLESKTKSETEKDNMKQEYEAYFSNLVLYARQPDVESTRKLIDDMFTENFGNQDPEISEKFIRYIDDFFSKDGEMCPFLTKNEIKEKLLELLLDPLMPEPGEIIEAEHADAWSTFFDGSSLFVIDDLSATQPKPTQPNPIGILYSLLELKLKAEISLPSSFKVNLANWDNYYSDPIEQIREFKNGQIMESLQKYENLTPKRLLVAMWKFAGVPLVLKVHDETMTYLNKVLSRNLYVPKNYVVICQKIGDLKAYDKYKVCTSLAHSADQTKVLNTLTLSLQNRSDITLGHFIGKNTEILKKISLTMLLKFFQKVSVIIGEKLPIDPKRYMKRKFYKAMFDIDVMELKNMIFFMEGSLPRWLDPPPTIDEFVERHLKDDNYKLEETIIITMNDRKIHDVKKYIKEIRQSARVANYGIHYFRKEKRSHKMEWLASWGAVEDFLKFAIDRDDDFDEKDIIEECDVPSHFGEVNMVNIVCADPGMGKSTILDRLTYQYDDRWIVRINLVEYYNSFKEGDLNKKMLSDPIAYFYNALRFRNIDDFTDEMFKYYKNEEKLGIFVDGFDEVGADHRPNVLKMLNEIMKKNDIIWIAARTVLKKEIQEGINVIAIDMKNLTNEDIENYFSDVEIKYSLTDITVKEVINKIGMDFLRIPLHANIVATVLEDEEPVKPRNFNEFELPDWYEEFIQMKFRTYFRKKEKIDTNQSSVEESAQKKLREIHEKMALILIYGVDDLLAVAVVTKFELEIISLEIQSSKIGLGIITAINDFTPVFLHRMFADYLGAYWLAHNNDLKFKVTMHSRLMIPEWRTIRGWFNMVIAKDHPLHAAVYYNRTNKILELCNNKELEGKSCMYKDNFERTPLHLLFGKIGSRDVGFETMRTLNTLLRFIETSEEDVRFIVDWFGKDWLAYSRITQPKGLYYGALRHGFVHIVKLLMGRTVTLV